MELEDFRKQLDVIDSQIVKLLGKRIRVIDEIGRYKAVRGLAVRDEARFQALLARLKVLANQDGAPPELVEQIYHQIHEASIAREQNIEVK